MDFCLLWLSHIGVAEQLSAERQKGRFAMSEKARLTNQELELTQRIQTLFPRGEICSTILQRLLQCPADEMRDILLRAFGLPKNARNFGFVGKALIEVPEYLFEAEKNFFGEKKRIANIFAICDRFHQYFLSDSKDYSVRPATLKIECHLLQREMTSRLMYLAAEEFIQVITLDQLWMILFYESKHDKWLLNRTDSEWHGNIFFVRDAKNVVRIVHVRFANGWWLSASSFDHALTFMPMARLFSCKIA